MSCSATLPGSRTLTEPSAEDVRLREVLVQPQGPFLRRHHGDRVELLPVEGGKLVVRHILVCQHRKLVEQLPQARIWAVRGGQIGQDLLEPRLRLRAGDSHSPQRRDRQFRTAELVKTTGRISLASGFILSFQSPVVSASNRLILFLLPPGGIGNCGTESQRGLCSMHASRRRIPMGPACSVRRQNTFWQSCHRSRC